jgi:ApeA N-terminal domain 1
MRDFYGVRSRFETDGVFWDAEDPKRTFSAHLSSNAHIELTVSAETAGPDGRATEYVLGTTTIGPCTLIGLHKLLSNRYFSGATGQVVLSRRFRVSACIIGCHLKGDTEPLLRSGWFTYSGIDQWFPGAGELAMTEEATSVSYPTKFPVVVDFCIPCARSRVKIVVVPNLQMTHGGRRVTARTQPRISIEPAHPRSLQWFIDLAVRFENFFSVCLGTSVHLRATSLETVNDEHGWFVAHRRRRKAEKPDLQAWVECDSSRLMNAIATWFAIPEVFLPIENLVYGAIRGSSLVAETEFLSLAQAIESFHRLTDSTTIISPDSFKGLLEWLGPTIAERYAGSAIEERVWDAIQHCNEPSFHHRIESLVSRISQTNAQRLLGDTALFEKSFRQTRNYLTHPGTMKKLRVLTEAADLFLFNQKLHAFLRLLMLLYLGFPEEEVCRPVQYQSRRWRIV